MHVTTAALHRPPASPAQSPLGRPGTLGGVKPTEAGHRSQWERRVEKLPYPTLALSVIAAVSTATQFESDTPLLVTGQILLVAAAAGWTWWWRRHRSHHGVTTSGLRVHFVGRTVITFALTLINPVFAIYAILGFFDLAGVFRGGGQWLATLAVSVMVAGAGVGGLPPESSWQWLTVAVLTVLNSAVVLLIISVQRELQIRTREQAATITELEQVNLELEHSLTEIETLQATIREQARQAGIGEERRRLARELHDTIAQSLAGALAQLRASENDADPRPRIDQASRLTREALSEARRSVMDLAPAQLTGSLLRTALEDLVSTWNSRHDPIAALHVVGDERPLHPEVEATVLRITQEALTNVARHALAVRVGITLTYDEADVTLDVRDDGAGFDPDSAPGPASFGLRSMRQRAARLLGTLDIESAPGTGTALSVRLPALDRGETP